MPLDGLRILGPRDRVRPFRRVGQRIGDGCRRVLDIQDSCDIRTSRRRELARGDATDHAVADFTPGKAGA